MARLVGESIDWAARWNEGRIGFHQESVNAILCERWPELVPDEHCRVLVPLCGKSKDMLWLLRRGHTVVGVELCDVAVEAFFDENGLAFAIDDRGDHRVYVGKGDASRLSLIVGDFFQLRHRLEGSFDAVYDRAAIVALPRQRWDDYSETLDVLMSASAVGLMLTFEYPQSERRGPPFSVSLADVSGCFGSRWIVDMLDRIDLTESNRWNLSQIHEPVIHLIRR